MHRQEKSTGLKTRHYISEENLRTTRDQNFTEHGKTLLNADHLVTKPLRESRSLPCVRKPARTTETGISN